MEKSPGEVTSGAGRPPALNRLMSLLALLDDGECVRLCVGGGGNGGKDSRQNISRICMCVTQREAAPQEHYVVPRLGLIPSLLNPLDTSVRAGFGKRVLSASTQTSSLIETSGHTAVSHPPRVPCDDLHPAGILTSPFLAGLEASNLLVSNATLPAASLPADAPKNAKRKCYLCYSLTAGTDLS